MVTPPLKLWHTFRALELVYRDAYHSQLNDRYAGKRDEFHELAKWAYEKVIQTRTRDGDRSGAAGRRRRRRGRAPGGLADGTYYVAMAWTNAAGEEGACSTPATIDDRGQFVRGASRRRRRERDGLERVRGHERRTALTLQNERTAGARSRPGSQPDSAVDERDGRPGSGQAPNYLHAGAADDTEGLMTSKIGSAVTAQGGAADHGPERGERGPGGADAGGA